MKITNSALQLESSHSQAQRHEVTESMRLWIGDRPQDSSAANAAWPGLAALDDGQAGRVSLSEAGRTAQAAESSAVDTGIDVQDFRLLLIRYLLERMIGKEIEVFEGPRTGNPQASAPSAPSAASDPGYGIEYDRHESYSEAEQMNFSASGVVQTADGKTIGFSLSMSMERFYHFESDVSLRLGNAARPTHDPLVVNFSGSAAQLTDQRFQFDLDADGEAGERINFLGRGSGFLAFDRNGDGVINDGSELFGARSGNGFAELAELDGDRNGWIDENDEAFAFLSVWIKDSAGTDALRSLKDMGIGAISLSNVSSPFSIKDGNNDLLGVVRAGGFYLMENGGVGTLQQIDLTV